MSTAPQVLPLWCPSSGTHLIRVKLQATRWTLYMILDLLSKCPLWMWLLSGAAPHA